MPLSRLLLQARDQHLVEHEQQRWIRLKPDLLICHGEQRLVVLDTKWSCSMRTGTTAATSTVLHRAISISCMPTGRPICKVAAT
ncbi:5-methylcytosine restriction system specificity protein McrC [Tahibacter aquaticus]|uniref:5-methylcytosine restriction system specificity protein McrC n=1 Tax=Tahibacter aquaticus TaxID=520092 RepID=UPI001AADD37A